MSRSQVQILVTANLFKKMKINSINKNYLSENISAQSIVKIDRFGLNLARFDKLQVLNVSDTLINGQDLQGLPPSLIKLSLYNCKGIAAGEFDPNLAHLVNLQELDVRGTLINGQD